MKVNQIISYVIENVLNIALSHSEVRNMLHKAGYGSGGKFLNYIVPSELATDGHYKPKNVNSGEYKMLFTKAIANSNKKFTGVDIIKNNVERIPIVVVRLNTITEEVIKIDKPPQYSHYGNIPVPLF